MTKETLKKYGLIRISDVKLTKNYIKCLEKDCKCLSFNDDDSVCKCCGSKNTLRITKD